MDKKRDRKKSSTTTANLSTLVRIEHKAYHYLERSRLGGWTVAAVFVLLGEWYSLKNFPLYSTIFALFAVIGITSAGSWINWIFDRKLDKFAGKDISFFAKHISPREMFSVSLIITSLSLILLLYINRFVFAIGLLMFAIFLIYSAPPLRIKTVPPLDCVANALVFGTIPFFLGWMINGNWLSLTAVLYGITGGLVVISYYLILSSFDIEKDKEYGIETSCTKLGAHASVNAGIYIFFIALIIAIISFRPFSFFTVALLISSPLFATMKIKNDHRSLRILLSSIYYLFTESIILSLFLYSHSIILITLFIFILIMGISVICYYLYASRG